MTSALEDSVVRYLIWHPNAVLECDVGMDWFVDPACRETFGEIARLVICDGERFAQVDGYLAIGRAVHPTTWQVLEARGVTEICEVADFARLVRDLRVAYERRAATDQATHLIAALAEGEEPRLVMERTVGAFDALVQGHEHAVTSYRDAVQDRAAAALSGTSNTELVPTGFRELDESIGGVPVGGLTVIGARPGRGKSAFLQQICEAVVQADPDARTLLATPEMASWEVGDRGVARVSGVPLRRLRDRFLSSAHRAALQAVQADPPAAFGRITIYDEPRQSSLAISRMARRIAMQGDTLRLIAVDYLQYLDEERQRDEPRYERIGRSVRALKSTARQLKAACVVGAQLKRDAEDGEPTLAHLRESGDIEQDADVVLMLGNPVEIGGAGDGAVLEVPVHVRKARQGACDTILLRWHGAVTSFCD